MPSMPLKPEYGPTLGRLLAPRWHAATPLTRRAIQACGVLFVLGAVALALTLLNATYSHGRRVPFSFAYRGLYRVAPDPGGYVKIEKRRPDGALLYSFAVEPLRLAPYSVGESAELPLYASTYIRRRRATLAGFVPRGEGKTRVNTVPAYDILYEAQVEGRPMYGRDVLLIPERAGAREGVAIVMLTAPGASKQVRGPIEVATTGVLLRPLRSFSLG
jgi:hypothetical protein